MFSGSPSTIAIPTTSIRPLLMPTVWDQLKAAVPAACPLLEESNTIRIITALRDVIGGRVTAIMTETGEYRQLRIVITCIKDRHSNRHLRSPYDDVSRRIDFPLLLSRGRNPLPEIW